MRSKGSPELLEYRRYLALRLLEEGLECQDVAEVLEISRRSVQRWWRWAQHDPERLLAAAVPGAPAKLPEKYLPLVFSWLEHRPEDFGYLGERWTAPRLAGLLERKLGIHLNHRYLNDWLRRHGITPQIPSPVAREREPELIAGWMHYRWPWLKKRPGSCRRRSDSPMKAAF